MAKLKNLNNLFDIYAAERVTVGNNRTITRVASDKHFDFECRLHGHMIARVTMGPKAQIAKITLDDCGYPTRTTRAAMEDFARAFGATLSVSFAGGGMSARFKNAAGAYVDREDLVRGSCNGPFALGRSV